MECVELNYYSLNTTSWRVQGYDIYVLMPKKCSAAELSKDLDTSVEPDGPGQQSTAARRSGFAK